MDFEYLADNKQAIPIIANWYFNEWGTVGNGTTLEKFTDSLHDYMHIDQIPLMLLGIEEGKFLGVVQLKYREMTIYPEKEHWLGGVYVSEKYRSNKIAERLITRLIDIAKKLDVKTLHLQTDKLDGGLYSRLGWQPIEQANYRGRDVLVMEYHICV